jgi:prepilin-type N-terminal cleavage/methylation domain-containing protein
MNHKAQRAVTLIELVVVMAIIAIGAILFAPNMGAWIQNYRLRSGTQEVVSLLRTAQMKAISTNRHYGVYFDPGGSIILQQTTASDTSVDSNWSNEGEPQKLSSGITITNNFQNRRAHFNSDSTSAAGSISLQNTKGMQKTITVISATGRVHVDN